MHGRSFNYLTTVRTSTDCNLKIQNACLRSVRQQVIWIHIENSIAANKFYIWISHFLETAIFRTRFHPKSDRRRRGRRNASAVCRPPAADAHRRGLSQPLGAYARHCGSLWLAQRARAPCMTRTRAQRRRLSLIRWYDGQI